MTGACVGAAVALQHRRSGCDKVRENTSVQVVKLPKEGGRYQLNLPGCVRVLCLFLVAAQLSESVGLSPVI